MKSFYKSMTLQEYDGARVWSQGFGRTGVLRGGSGVLRRSGGSLQVGSHAAFGDMRTGMRVSRDMRLAFFRPWVWRVQGGRGMKSFYKSMTLQEFGRKDLAGLTSPVETPASLAGLEGRRRVGSHAAFGDMRTGMRISRDMRLAFSDLGFGACRVDGA